jgi:fumarylacetoacetate (FAA) hydrolase family protein
MSFYPINITATITEEKLQKGTFIFIYRATRIPPHIGIITNGLLYDITSVGPNIDLAVSDFFKTAVKRKTEVLFVELNLPKAETNKIISEKVNNHWKVTPTTSCLDPVKEFLNEVCKIDLEQATFLFDLLPVLEKENLIESVFELNLQKKIEDNIFKLTKYTQQDIQDCIVALSRKEKIS